MLRETNTTGIHSYAVSKFKFVCLSKSWKKNEIIREEKEM